MLDVVFAVQRSDVRATECTATGVTKQIEASEIIGLAEGILIGRMVGYGKEFGGDDLSAVLQGIVSNTKSVAAKGKGGVHGM